MGADSKARELGAVVEHDARPPADRRIVGTNGFGVREYRRVSVTSARSPACLNDRWPRLATFVGSIPGHPCTPRLPSFPRLPVSGAMRNVRPVHLRALRQGVEGTVSLVDGLELQRDHHASGAFVRHAGRNVFPPTCIAPPGNARRQCRMPPP